MGLHLIGTPSTDSSGWGNLGNFKNWGFTPGRRSLGYRHSGL